MSASAQAVKVYVRTTKGIFSSGLVSFLNGLSSFDFSKAIPPNIKVKLAGKDAFNLLGRVKKEMRRAGLSPEEINEFTQQAMAGDYDWLLGTVQEYVQVD